MDGTNIQASMNPTCAASEQQTFPLLDLITSPGLNHVSDILVSHIATGECGPMSILNLRKVCIKTRKWVDELRPALSKRIYSEIVAFINLSNGYESDDDDPGESDSSEDPLHEGYCKLYTNSKGLHQLEKFQRIPPPPGVTSLQLRFPKNMFDEHMERSPVEFFFNYWSTKLDFLHVNYYYEPLMDAFKKAPLQTLIVETLEHWPEEDSKFYDIPEVSLRWGPAMRSVDAMKRNNNLQRFYFGFCEEDIDDEYGSEVEDSEDENDDEDMVYEDCVNIQKLEELITAKKDDTQFKLTADPVTFLLKDEAVLRRFVSCVVASKSKIRFSLKDRHAVRIHRNVSESLARKFFSSIEDIWCYNEKDDVESFRVLLNSGYFFNLKRLKENGKLDNHPTLYALDVQCLPRGLESLQTSSKFLTAQLPTALRFLHLNNGNWTLLELQEFTLAISKTCQKLEKLSLNLKLETPLKAEDWKGQEKLSFPSLKTLQVELQVYFEDNAESVRLALLNVLQIHEMKLHSLKIKGIVKPAFRINLLPGSPPASYLPKLNHGLIESVISNSLGNTLVDFTAFEVDELFKCSPTSTAFTKCLQKNKEKWKTTRGHRSKEDFKQDRFNIKADN